MSTEERLRRLLHSAGPPPAVTENDWSIFVGVAHRNRRHRVTAMVAVVLVLGAAVGVWGADRLGDLTLPADDPLEPVILTDDVPRECPEAAAYEPESDFGTVAFVRDGDLYRTDLRGGEAKLVESGGRAVTTDVEWGRDGRWISFGRGLVVPARGGALCDPLGDGVLEPTWAADDVLVGMDGGTLVIGGPGREPRRVDVSPLSIRSFAVDPSGRRVALGVDELAEGTERIVRTAAVQTLDIGADEPATIMNVDGGLEARSPQIAGWSPDGEWILYWLVTQDPGINARGVPLEAVRTSGGAPVRITDEIVPFREAISWCGDTLILEAPDRRVIPEGRRLAAAQPPGWAPEPLTNLASYVWTQPSCSPFSHGVAALTYPVYPKKESTTGVSVLGIGGGHDEEGILQGGEFRNPTEWSADGNWFLVEVKSFGTNGLTLRLWDYRSRTGVGGPGLFSIDLGEEANAYGPRAYDWYQP